MLLGNFFRQERFAKRAWELNAKDPACVHVSRFCATETALPFTKLMWISMLGATLRLWLQASPNSSLLYTPLLSVFDC